MSTDKKENPRKVKSSRKSSSKASSNNEKTVSKDSSGSGYNLKDQWVEQALISGEYRDQLEQYFGEEVYQELSSLAKRASTERTRGGPRVLLLPGIMGSKLGTQGLIFDDTIWIDPVDIIAGNLTELAYSQNDSDIEPLGVILLAYLKLKLKLRLAGFDVDFYPFDWRKSIPDLGQELAARIKQETGEGSKHQDLYLVAHSMGGLVSRMAYKILLQQGESERDRIRRLIMLGTPNFGSFAPVQVFSGSYDVTKKVAALDLANSHEKLINEVFNTFPGLHEMLPDQGKFSTLDLYNLANWPSNGVGPRKELLHTVPLVHQELKLQPGQEQGKFTLIAGINQETVVGVRREGDEFIYAQSREGDGTVPLTLALLDGVPTYYIEESHGSLPNNSDVGRAVIELLETGQTGVLPMQWHPVQRGVIRELRASELAPVPYDARTGEKISQREKRYLLEELVAPPRLVRDQSITTVSSIAPVFSSEPVIVGRKRQQRIDLRLAFGSVTQVDTRAVAVGLFHGVAPSGAARAIDVQLGGVISEFTERRMISAGVGDIFIMPSNRYRTGTDMLVFVGLGTYDDFNEEVLRLASENLARALVRTKVDEFATVMLGSGCGMSVSETLVNLIKGFLRGVAEGDHENRLRSITLCELDQGRFQQMYRETLRLTATSLFDDVEVTVESVELPAVISTVPDSTERTAITGKDPVYLIVREMPDISKKETDPALSASFTLRASLLTAGEKATVVTDLMEVNAGELHKQLEKIETRDFQHDKLQEFGAELAKIVLPDLVLKALHALQDRQLVVIHDARTARIPWETVNIEGWFPAAGEGLSRKYEAEDLSVAKWLEERRLDNVLNVLLIINPTRDLPGAEVEGDRIRVMLEQLPSVKIDELRGIDATWSAVRAAFRSGKYDIVHYAGHAFFDPFNRARSGIVCHGDKVLSGKDLSLLEILPALVFFNACEAGRVRSASQRKSGTETAKRLETNVSLAEAFLRAGVGNYLGTYWPVGDGAAKEFAETFYQLVIQGKSLGQAINAGREQVRALKSVDWADYIHYGSPGFFVKRR